MTKRPNADPVFYGWAATPVYRSGRREWKKRLEEFMWHYPTSIDEVFRVRDGGNNEAK